MKLIEKFFNSKKYKIYVKTQYKNMHREHKKISKDQKLILQIFSVINKLRKKMLIECYSELLD